MPNHPSVTGIPFDITECLKIKEEFAHRVYACILRYVNAAADPHGGASAVAHQHLHLVTRFKEILYLNLNFYSAYELFLHAVGMINCGCGILWLFVA